MALGLGAVATLAFAPFGWWPVALVSVAGLVALWNRCRSRKEAASIGFAFGFAWFQAGTYWLYICLVGNGGVPMSIALVLMLGLTLLMGSYTAVLGALVYPVLRSQTSTWAKVVLIVCGWVLTEYFRAWFLSGFPWLALGYSGLDTPFQGYAPVVGVYGLSALMAGLAVPVGLLGGNVLRAPAWWVSAAVIVALGLALQTIHWTTVSGERLSVGLVQGAIPQDEKWQEGREAEITGRYIGLTEQALGQDLIVWPESSLPFLYQDAERLLTALNAMAQLKHSTLVLGLIHAKDGHYFNGIAVIGDPVQWYDKRHLVPFGEYFPVPSWVRQWMRLAQLPYTDFTAGSDPPSLLRAKGQVLGGSVCYEDAFNQEQLAFLSDATLLVNVTNDTWFGDSTAPHQHLQISRMRALEAGRYLMRVANSGVSAVIGPDGKIEARSPQFEPYVLRASVVPMTGLTPFARMGNTPIILVLLLPWLLWGLKIVRNRSQRSAQSSASGNLIGYN